MSRLEAVVFDFGNVLATVDRLAVAKALARHSPLPADQIVGTIWGTDLERDAETGAIDSREHFRRLRERLAADGSWRYEEFVEEFLEGIEVNPEGIEAARWARSRGKRLFVLSNTSYNHARWLFRNEEIMTLFEGYVLSFKVGAMKPDPAIWRYLLASTGLEASRCLYIDDIEAFCAAAERLGFATIHYAKGRTPLLERLEAALA